MNIRVFTVETELTSKNTYEPLLYKQYDNGNELEIKVFNENEPVILVDETVVGFYKLTNGVIIQKDCSIKDGNILAVLDNNILATSGKTKAEFSIYKNNTITTTSTIIIEVEESIDRENALISVPHWDVVQRILEFNEGQLVEEIETLSDKIDLASQLKIDLGNNITQGTTLKNQLNTAIGTAQTKKTELESAITTGDLNNYAKKTDLNEINNTLGSGVVATPSLSYGMNSKIVNPVKVPVIPEVAWSGRHYVNLLGKDGNCEDVSKWIDWLSTHTIDTANKVFRNSSMKITLTSASGSINTGTRPIDASKYYLVSAYLKPGTGMGIRMIVENGSNAFFNQTPLITDSSKFTRVSLKLSPYQHDTGIRISFAVDGATGNYGYVDGVMLTEITQAEYNDAGYEPPYVDSYGILTNPYIEIRHDNLVMNGNGEEGINWWKLAANTGKLSVENGKFKIETSVNGCIYAQQIKLKKNTNYYIKGNFSNPSTSVIRVLNSANFGSTLAANANMTFNSGNNEEVSVVMWADIGISYFDSIMIIEGSSSPTTYKPCRIEKCVIEGKFGYGDTVTLKNGKAEGLINWKHKILYGKDYDWQFVLSSAGYKFIVANGKFKGSSLDYTTFYVVKYEGKIIPWGNTASDQYDFTDVTIDTLGLRVPATDSGFSDAVNPNSDEIKAFMNGWKAILTNGTRYLLWASVIDNSLPTSAITSLTTGTSASGQAVLNVTAGDGNTKFAVGDIIAIRNSSGSVVASYTISAVSANTVTCSVNLIGTYNNTYTVVKADNGTTNISLLTWCKNNVAPNYEGYQLHYKLANPEPITDTNTKVVGDIPKIDTGDNYIYIDSGIVLDETAPWVKATGYTNYYLNVKDNADSGIPNGSKLKYMSESLFMQYKNGVVDINGKYSIGSIANLNYGNWFGQIANSDFDDTAAYTLDYKILATIAPNVGSISCSFKQDLVSGVTSVANALESRQKSDSALDRLIDLSLYEEIDSTVFDVFIPYIVASDGTTYINLPFDFKVTKKVTPIIKLLALKIFSGADYSNVTNLFKMNFVKLDKNKGVIGLYASNSAFSTSIKGAGIYVNYKIVADCRGRI